MKSPVTVYYGYFEITNLDEECWIRIPMAEVYGEEGKFEDGLIEVVHGKDYRDVRRNVLRKYGNRNPVERTYKACEEDVKRGFKR